MGKSKSGGNNQKAPTSERKPDHQDGFVARRSQNVSGKKYSQSDGDTWQETLAVCEIANVLTIRSYFTNLRTSVRVWDEPPSGASKIIDATEEMRRMASLQLQEMLIATGQVGTGTAVSEPSTPSKQKPKVFRSLFGRKNGSSNNDSDGTGPTSVSGSTRSKASSSSSRIQYKQDSFLAKTSKKGKTAPTRDRDMTDPALQEALAASIAEASGREHISETTRRRARIREDHSITEDHDLEMALAISASEATHHRHRRGRSPTARDDTKTRGRDRLERSRSPPGGSDRSIMSRPGLDRAHSVHSGPSDVAHLESPTAVDNNKQNKKNTTTTSQIRSSGQTGKKRGAVVVKRVPTRSARDMSPMAPGEARYGVARHHGSSWSSVEETKMEESDHPHGDIDGDLCLDPMVARNEEPTRTGKKTDSPTNGSPTHSPTSRPAGSNQKSPARGHRSKSRSPPAVTPRLEMSNKEADDLAEALRLSELEHQKETGGATRESTTTRGRRRSKSSPPRQRKSKEKTAQEDNTPPKLSPPHQNSAPRRHPSRDAPLRQSPEQNKRRSVSASRASRRKPLGENNSSLSPISPSQTSRERPLKKSGSPGSAKRERPPRKPTDLSLEKSQSSASSSDSNFGKSPARRQRPSVGSRASSAPASNTTDYRGRSQHHRRPLMNNDAGQRGIQRTSESARKKKTPMLEPKIGKTLTSASASLHARPIKT